MNQFDQRAWIFQTKKGAKQVFFTLSEAQDFLKDSTTSGEFVGVMEQRYVEKRFKSLPISMWWLGDELKAAQPEALNKARRICG
jgi:hypothetical protein